MAGMDTRNSGRVLESSEAQLGGSTRPGNPGLEVWKWSGIPDLTLRPSHKWAWPVPYHAPRHCAQSCGQPACEQSSSPVICTPRWSGGASGHGCSRHDGERRRSCRMGRRQCLPLRWWECRLRHTFPWPSRVPWRPGG